MLSKLEIKWFYAVGILTVVLSLFLASKNIYYTPIVPIGLLVLYTAVYHTRKLLWFIVFSVPLSVNTLDVGFGLGISAPSEPLIVLLFVLLLLKLMMGGKVPTEIVKHPLAIIVLVNLFWMLVSVCFSEDIIVSLKYFLSRTWYVSVIFFLLIYLFKSLKNIDSFFYAFLIGFSCLAMYTFTQHALEGFVLSHNFFIMAPFYPDHTMYGASLAFAVPIAAIFTFQGSKLGVSRLVSVILFFVFALVVVGIIFSFTRAAWVSLVGTAGVLGLLLLKVKFRTLMGILALGLVFLVLNQDRVVYQMSGNKQGSASDFEGHVESIGNISTDPSNMERINRWKSGYRMFLDRPITGFGPGTYVNEYGAYQCTEDLTLISTFSGDLGNAHSEYISSLSEMGLVGFLSWVGIFLVSVYYGFKLFYHSTDPKVRTIALAALLGLTTYYLHGFLNNYSDFDKIAVPLWSLLAVLVSLDLYHAKYKEE